jgi:hypothetical protein
VTGVVRYRINGCAGAEAERKSLANSSGGSVLLLAGPGFAQSIWFRSSAVTFGARYYFACPDCGCKCGKLYLPAGDRRFACRWCHGLRYESQRHACDWFYRPLAASSGVKKRLLKQFLHGIGQSLLRG